MGQWTSTYCAFVVETYFKNGDSVVITQWLFCQHFDVPPHDAVSRWNTIKLWIVSTVWCVVASCGIIGPISLKRKDKLWQSLLPDTQWCYKKSFLLNCFIVELNWTLCSFISRLGNSPHCQTIHGVVRKMLPGHVISKGEDLPIWKYVTIFFRDT